MKIIEGGVCAAKGFSAGGIHCGIRHNTSKRDLAMILSSVRAATACCYTQNLVKGAPIDVTRSHIADGYAQGIIVNSGNANTCNADDIYIANSMCELASKHSEIAPEDFVIASTGVIGQPLKLDPIETGLPKLMEDMGKNSSHAAEAIMTTDTVKKEIAVEFSIGGKTCHMGGISKGSGMIHPNMATMLAFITTDTAITPQMLQKALSADVKGSFNLLSVDGDTSTNDTVCLMANALAENPIIDSKGESYDSFCNALSYVSQYLARQMAKDGEGATKLVECRVSGAKSLEGARALARCVIVSPLVKSAMFGADANWGRILCALGYAGVDIDVSKVAVGFSSSAGTIEVCKEGRGTAFSEEIAKAVLSQDEVLISVALEDGNAVATAWGCDLSYDYVKINGDYRT